MRARRPEALDHWRSKLAHKIDLHRFYQFEFFEQWRALKQHCGACGIRIMGDVPIYVAHDSADVWAHTEYFNSTKKAIPRPLPVCRPIISAPRASFGAIPLYRWDVLAATGYRWWIERLAATLATVDIIRLDHFRGFEAYWTVPAGETTAVNGQWIKGPGVAFLQAADDALGELPLVAENLGVITPEVEAMRNRVRFSRHEHSAICVSARIRKGPISARTITLETASPTPARTIATRPSDGGPAPAKARARARRKTSAKSTITRCRYLNLDTQEIHWAFIRALMASVANTVVFPLQDVLGLGSKARMNLPATPSGNWRWRFRSGVLTPALARRLQGTHRGLRAMTTATTSTRAPASFWQIWNMCFGFFGIQFGWGLQMANMSAIYEYLGAKPDQIPMLWLAAPLTGLIVQPIIGHLSDHTWGQLGRRRPYFLTGAILSSLGAGRHAQRPHHLDGRRTALDSGRFHQHQHGAIPRICRRPAARGPAHARLRHAEPVHRARRGHRLIAALDAGRATAAAPAAAPFR